MNKTGKISGAKYSSEEIASCIALLENLSGDSQQIAHLPAEQRNALMSAAGRLSRPDRIEIRKRRKDVRQIKRRIAVSHDRHARAVTGIRSARESSIFIAPKQISQTNNDLKSESLELKSPRNCYICKAEYKRMHFFYDALCPACAEFNYQKRFQTVPLDGTVAVITGSRLKIGYQVTLAMLRAGARVIATTRFPVDSALRFSREQDFFQWKDLLHIYGLDLRHTPSVEIFCKYIEQKYNRLDILINNAAQTVRRPPGFYAHLMPGEIGGVLNLSQDAQALLRDYQECKKQLNSYSKAKLAAELALAITWNAKEPGVGLRASAQLSQIPYAYDQSSAGKNFFPQGQLDADLQQVDLREKNSWRLRLGEIQTSEMLEIQLVNAIAPFVLCNKLSGLMKRDNTGQKHIVNVSAMEGKFLRFRKAPRHPHTNMAKAALNMLTHTSASDLAEYGIFMNSVDTGWVTDEDPVILAARKKECHDFQPPLDIVDGAARVCDPFFNGILTGKHWCGKFLKDYYPIDW